MSRVCTALEETNRRPNCRVQNWDNVTQWECRCVGLKWPSWSYRSTSHQGGGFLLVLSNRRTWVVQQEKSLRLPACNGGTGLLPSIDESNRRYSHASPWRAAAIPRLVHSTALFPQTRWHRASGGRFRCCLCACFFFLFRPSTSLHPSTLWKKYSWRESAGDITLDMAKGAQSDMSPSPWERNYEWGSTERRPFSVSSLRKVKRNFTGNRELRTFSFMWCCVVWVQSSTWEKLSSCNSGRTTNRSCSRAKAAHTSGYLLGSIVQVWVCYSGEYLVYAKVEIINTNYGRSLSLCRSSVANYRTLFVELCPVKPCFLYLYLVHWFLR